MSKDDKAQKPKAAAAEAFPVEPEKPSSPGRLVRAADLVADDGESAAAVDKPKAAPKKGKLRLPKTVEAEREANETPEERRVRLAKEEWEDFWSDDPDPPPPPDFHDPAVPYGDVIRKPGPTRVEGEITLHTRICHRLFYGRRAVKKTVKKKRLQPIIGLVRFVSNTNSMCDACTQDDPYADYRLLQIEDAFDKTMTEIDTYLGAVRDLLDAGESRRVKVVRSGSVRPATFRLQFQYTYGFRGADLLGRYDELVDASLAARHIGRFGETEWGAIVQYCGRRVRHVFALSANFRYSGTWRHDFASNNAKALQAIEKYGELPQEVLSGDLRPKLAPAPKRGPLSKQEAGAES